MSVWFATREDVKNALDVKSTAFDDAQIDRIIEAASRSVEEQLHIYPAPILETRYFDWPGNQMSGSYGLWLEEDTLITLVALVTGGEVIPTTISGTPSWYLWPSNAPSKGQPYRKLEMNLASTQSFQTGSTHQRDIAITGLWGYSDTAVRIGTQSGSLNATDDIINTVWAGVGVGSVIRCDDERMICTDRNFADTTRTLSADLGVLDSAKVVQTNGATIYPGEEIMIDAERMLVTSRTGNNLQVKRAYSGSTLAAHTTGATIYSARAFTVTRGALGTVAATHANGAAWTVWQVPGPIRTLCIAEAISTFEQEQSGYARTVGSGEGERNASGAGLAAARKAAVEACGRQARAGAI